MNKRKAGAAAILVGLVLTSMNVAADATLYRWKDSQGNMVMSDRPPPAGVEYEAIRTDASVVRRKADEPAPTQVVPAPKPSEPEPAPSTPTNSVYKKNPEYCKNARTNLEILERPRIRFTDSEGETRFMTEEEREEERQKAIEIVNTHCE